MAQYFIGRPIFAWVNATITAQSRLQTPEQFRDIILRSNSDGSLLKLGDVARVELGAESYSIISRYSRQPATGIAVMLATGANALETAAAVEDLLVELKPYFPPGLRTVIPFETTPFVRVAIKNVIEILLEAIVLVFLVMYLFLQNFRATLIPTIAVPVVLLGTFGMLAILGFSVNMLTMFAMVLAIGLLVDDAIVVVENVERLMTEEGLSPLEATGISMRQITGALVAIFLTPALCATMLKPLNKGEHYSDTGFLGWFNRFSDRSAQRYRNGIRGMLARSGRFMALFLVLVGLMAILFFNRPTSFLPQEDQGTLFAQIVAPVGATQERTMDVVYQVEDYFLEHEKDNIEAMMAVQGFSFGGGGQNNAMAFIRLKDWDERTRPDQDVRAIAQRASVAFSQIKDALVFAFAPPAIQELGRSSGFTFYLEDKASLGHEALMAASGQLLMETMNSPLLVKVRHNGQADAPQFRLDIDYEKASALGLSVAAINATLQASWGGQYIDDFIDRGRVKRVYMQAEAPFRMVPEDFKMWSVRNENGDMVPFSAFAGWHWDYGSPRLERYNGVPALEINGEAPPGVSSGAAMAEVERIVSTLGPGIGMEWTGLSYQERRAGAQVPLLYTLSILIISFAKDNLEQGMELIEATMQAVRDRLRPIIMTSLAFGMGVMPLVLASGAGSGAQHAIGTGVLGGMIVGAFLGVFFIPLFFVMVQKWVGKHGRAQRQQARTASEPRNGSDST